MQKNKPDCTVVHKLYRQLDSADLQSVLTNNVIYGKSNKIISKLLSNNSATARILSCGFGKSYLQTLKLNIYTLCTRERIRAVAYNAEEFVNGHGKNFRAIEPMT